MTATLPPEATDESKNSRSQTIFSLDPAVDFVDENSPMFKCYHASKSVKLDVATSAKGKKAKSALAKVILLQQLYCNDEYLKVGINRKNFAKMEKGFLSKERCLLI
jgi:hypothetical protein